MSTRQVIINPAFPMYIDRKKRVARLGNLKKTGKIIEDIDDNLEKIFNMCIHPISIEKIMDSLLKDSQFTKDEVDQLIESLIVEDILVDYKDFIKLKKDNRFNRQLLFFSMFTGYKKAIVCHKRLKKSAITILGMGSIGGSVASQLVRSGIETINIVDSDVVEESNIERQLLYEIKDLGQMKVTSAAEKLKNINPNIHINSFCKTIRSVEDVSLLIKKTDFVLCTIDKPSREIREIVNSACVKNNIPALFCGFSEYLGLVGPFVVPHKSACLNCIKLEIGPEIDQQYLNPNRIISSFGPICGLISGIASLEIIKWLSKFSESKLIGNTLMIDMMNYNMTLKNWTKNSFCSICKE